MHVLPSSILASLSHFVLLLAPTVYLAEGQQEGGHWGAWSEVSACSVTCGSGTQKKVRQWIPGQGEPVSDKKWTSTEMFTCSSSVYRECPTDGVWSEWYAATPCTKMCGGGTQRRRRDCLGQSWGGHKCDGEEEDQAKCNEVPCPPLHANFDMSQCKVPNNFTCSGGLMCVPNSQRCDRKLNCYDGSDEFNCTVAYRILKSVGDSGSLSKVDSFVILGVFTAIVVLILH